MRFGITLVVLSLIAAVGLAACPDAIGTWSTYDGSLIAGRVSEAWCGAGGVPFSAGQPGNTENGMSWNGAALGTQWRLWGMQISAEGAAVLSDTVNEAGYGVRVYQTAYDGGEFWLAGDGSWTDGPIELAGVVYDYLVTSTVTYVGGSAMAQVSNVTFNGAVSDCPDDNACVVEVANANAALVWDSGSGPAMPADYPAFLCDATTGELFTASDITIGIDCAIPAAAIGWSALKDMYR